MSNDLSAVQAGCGEGCACGAAQIDESSLSSLIDRRRFVTMGALAAAAAALAACGGLGSSITAPSSVSLSLQVSDYAALANVGGVALVSASGSPVAVVRTSATTFVALSRICPHQGGTIETASGGFFCPNHGAEFDLNGTWRGGQRTSSMRSYPTSYDAVAGTVTVG
jgi:nitrite reductase/ring-hydroxylating ferredoxin subunit